MAQERSPLTKRLEQERRGIAQACTRPLHIAPPPPARRRMRHASASRSRAPSAVTGRELVDSGVPSQLLCLLPPRGPRPRPDQGRPATACSSRQPEYQTQRRSQLGKPLTATGQGPRLSSVGSARSLGSPGSPITAEANAPTLALPIHSGAEGMCSFNFLVVQFLFSFDFN